MSQAPQESKVDGTVTTTACDDVAATAAKDMLPDPPQTMPMHTLSRAALVKDPDFNKAHLSEVPKGYEISNEINTSNKLCIVYNFINNEYIVPQSKEYFNNVNPATNQVIAKVAQSDSKDVDLAVAAAKKALPSWRALPAETRSKYLTCIADEIEKRLDEFAILESRDNGKPVLLASMVDAPRAVKNFRFFASQIMHDATQCHQRPDSLNYTHRSALGVCALITPWNLPLYLLTWKIAPAIACGNTVVCKPSELTPMTAYLLTKCVLAASLPAGVINIIQGGGKQAGEPLICHTDVRAISFTGSSLTGGKIAALAAPTFKKVSLECGGKNASIVFEDCDFERTVAGVCKASFANQGQVCLCGERIFVQRGKGGEFAKRFVRALCELTIRDYSSKIGNPLVSSYGSLISLEHRKKVDYYVQLARNSGAKIVLGGAAPERLNAPFNEGAFYLPTIITGLKHDHRCSLEEIFGPIVTVHEFDQMQDVVKMCNQVRYGLAGSVWTQDLKTAHKVAQEMETGMVWVNCWLERDLRVPFGGVKMSGMGTEGGTHSMDFWTNQKNICIKLD